MKRLFGAHYLAFFGALKEGQGDLLADAAKTAALAGCDLFELVLDPLNGLGAEEAAAALLQNGIKKASICRFFPGDGSLGDPLGDGPIQAKARETLVKDVEYIQVLRRAGVEVEHIVGPNVFALGKKYAYNRIETRNRIVEWVRLNKRLLSDAKLQLNIEYLRPGEDENVIGSMNEACNVVLQIDLPFVKIHGDTFHMLKRNERPQDVIRQAGGFLLGYLHAHGSDRLPPSIVNMGGKNGVTDEISWQLMGDALNAIDYRGPIVSEPFGAEVRALIPALGEGLPPAVDPVLFYDAARRCFVQNKIIV